MMYLTTAQWAMVQFPRETVGISNIVATPEAKSTVTTFEACPKPQPTISSFIDESPEPFYHRNSKRLSDSAFCLFRVSVSKFHLAPLGAV
jgi:hypothetical protein